MLPSAVNFCPILISNVLFCFFCSISGRDNNIQKRKIMMTCNLVEISPLKMGRKTETGYWKWLVIRQSCNAFFYQLLPFYGMALT